VQETNNIITEVEGEILIEQNEVEEVGEDEPRVIINRKRRNKKKTISI
jgi:hypothetical protein